MREGAMNEVYNERNLMKKTHSEGDLMREALLHVNP